MTENAMRTPMRFGRSRIGIGATWAKSAVLSEQDIELLCKSRDMRSGTKVSIGQAGSALLSDLVLEAA